MLKPHDGTDDMVWPGWMGQVSEPEAHAHYVLVVSVRRQKQTWGSLHCVGVVAGLVWFVLLVLQGELQGEVHVAGEGAGQGQPSPTSTARDSIAIIT